MFRLGKYVQIFFRSQRSVEALTDFLKKQLENQIHVVDSPQALSQQLDVSFHLSVWFSPGYFKY